MKENKENKLLVMPVNRLVWNVALPLMLSMLMQSLYNIVDSIFVARISLDALSATSLAYPVQMLMIALAVGIGVGLNAALSRSLGEQNLHAISDTAGNGIFLALVCWVGFFLFSIFGVKAFISLYHPEPAVLKHGMSYLRVVTAGSIGLFIAKIGDRCLQAIGKSWLSMCVQLSGCLTNLILDPVLIFGLGSIPAMGVFGAGLATIISQCLSAITALCLNYFLNHSVRFSISNIRPRLPIIKAILKVGAPTIVTQGCASIMSFGMNGLLSGISSLAVAFFGAYYKLQNFLYMPLNGLAQAMIPIVGYNYGAGKMKRTRKALFSACKISISFMAAGTLLFWLFPAQLLSLFSADSRLLEMGIPAIRILSTGFVFSAVTIIVGYYFTGLQNGMINMTATLIRQVVVLLPLVWLLERTGHFTWIWLAFPVSEGLAFLFAWYCAKHWNRFLNR